MCFVLCAGKIALSSKKRQENAITWCILVVVTLLLDISCAQHRNSHALWFGTQKKRACFSILLTQFSRVFCCCFFFFFFFFFVFQFNASLRPHAEIIKTIRDGEPSTATSTFTQLLELSDIQDDLPAFCQD